MVKRLTSTARFEYRASRPKRAIVLFFDLGGFSNFLNQPDVHEYVPRYINRVMEAMAICFFGGTDYWVPKPSEERALAISPIHEKYVGDGALYIWTPPRGEAEFSEIFLINLINRLWNTKKFFGEINKRCLEDVPVVDLPPKIRFGLAKGSVYELAVQGSSRKEYIGFCINLASRLQKYCPELGFIASARLEIPQTLLDKHGYIRVVASSIRGFPKEIVILDKNEYDGLEPQRRESLFEDLTGG